MTDDKVPLKHLPPGVSRIDEIDKRASALRENLKKRKAQSGMTASINQSSLKETDNEE